MNMEFDEEIIIKKASLMVSLPDLIGAIKVLRDGERRYPYSAKILKALGRVLLKNGQSKDAAFYFEKALNINHRSISNSFSNDEKLTSYYVANNDMTDGVKTPSPPLSFQDSINKKSKNIWIPKGTTIKIHGLSITDGLFYYGENIEDGWQAEPALIRPNMPVVPHSVDLSLSLMNEYPKYGYISNVARRGFLQWMADGRKAPNADIGYVFMFFYGLERRVLCDLSINTHSQNDVDEVVLEVERLLSIYGNNGSFRSYANSLLDYLDVIFLKEKAYMQEPFSYSVAPFELPMKLKVALGQMAVDKIPLSSEWALAWIKLDLRIPKRTPITRCQDKFEILFRDIYRNMYGDGFTLPINRTKLKVTYRPARSFIDQISIKSIPVNDLPDISAISDPINKLQFIVDKVAETLESYSRYVGRNPGSINSIDSLLFIPLNLWPSSSKNRLDDLIQKVHKNFVIRPYIDICKDIGADKALAKDKLTLLINLLDLNGVGFEPNTLFGKKVPLENELVALFSKKTGDDTETPVYHTASITLDLAVAVALADGVAVNAEINLLHHQISVWIDLNESQRARLKAQLELRIQQPIALENIKKKLEPVPKEAKRSIGHLLTQLAQADGVVVKEEIKLLERIYKALQLDDQLVYADLNSTVTNIELDKSVQKQKLPGFVLDLDRIAALQKETEHVSTLLASVFVDEVENAPIIQVEPPLEQDESIESGAGDNLLGLDNEHSNFLRFLIVRPEWTRQELTDVASDFKLMLDGALEQINEVALDHFDDHLIEGDEHVEINQNLLERILV